MLVGQGSHWAVWLGRDPAHSSIWAVGRLIPAAGWVEAVFGSFPSGHPYGAAHGRPAGLLVRAEEKPAGETGARNLCCVPAGTRQSPAPPPLSGGGLRRGGAAGGGGPYDHLTSSACLGFLLLLVGMHSPVILPQEVLGGKPSQISKV